MKMIKYRTYFSKGKRRTIRLYSVWLSMRQRCIPGRVRAARYGDRGIRVCNEWETDFDAFRYWAINNGYCKGLGIDRIDNDGNYSPSNCRFVNDFTQMRNTRQNVVIDFDGESLCQSEWAERIGISLPGLKWRLRHWPLEKALKVLS